MITASTAPGVGYYVGGGGSEDVRDASGRNYYTGAVEHRERPGQWSGQLADALGLTGIVGAHDMADVYERFVTPDGQPIGNGPRNYKSMADRVADALAKEPDALPERVEEIRSEVERSAQGNCRGMDLTFSVPKSVTVAYVAAWRAEQSAARDGQSERAAEYAAIRSAIDTAIQEANQTALAVAASIATTRTGWHGSGHAGQWVATPDLVVTSFAQLTSRADDPQFHIHNVVLNRGRTADGRIGALDTVDLRQWHHAYSAVADRVLSERLGDMGIRVAMRRDGVTREVVGIDQAALDTFSQRRAQITKAMAPRIKEREERLGRPMNRLEKTQLAQQINLATREAKGKGDVDWNEMLEHWQDRITDEIGTGLVPIAEHVRSMVERGATPSAASFSPEAVIAQAIQACAEERAAWSRADLILRLDMGLPDQMGLTSAQSVELHNRLADQALASEGVVQVAGKPGVVPPKDLVPGSWVRPSDALYAAPVTLEAENLILRAAVERGRGPTAGMSEKSRAAWGEQVHAWLDEHSQSILPGQRAAVVGLASSDAALGVLIGPAGTGKSFTVGALAGAWHDMTGGTVHGLTASRVAALELQSHGVAASDTLAMFRASQGRLAAGRPQERDLRNEIRPGDRIVIDEASMANKADLAYVHELAARVGVPVTYAGDPAQLSSTRAGGDMAMVAGRAETYTLPDVVRFSNEWERAASLGLRERQVEALREYDRRGRLVEVDTIEDACAAAARAAAADILADVRVSVSADRNEDAYRIGDLVRAHLVDAGRVDEQGVLLSRSGQIAGIGDVIMTRHIDDALGVLNGTKFSVVGTGEDGSLSVVGDDGVVRELPAEYVQGVTEDGAPRVHLGYASTVYGVQGRTLGRSYGVPVSSTSAASLYVMASRGADGNWLFVPLEPAASREQLDAGKVKVEAPEARPSAVSVLSDILTRETESRAAVSEAENDARHLASMDTVLDRLEEITHLACRARLDGDLDRLVEAGVLSEDDRASLGADQSTDHLSRVCRAAEQVGLDAQQVLRDAIADRPLDGLRSLAQGIAGRISSEHDLAASPPVPYAMPDRLPTEHAEFLAVLHGQAQDRARELGSQAAVDVPAWAAKELGPVPDDAMGRLEWEARAGAVAAYREAKGTEGDERTLTPMPGLSQTEARAAWNQAWDALGRPQETRTEAALTDGALHARVAAWEREQTWAPAHANASLRAASLDADEARREAILARAAGDEAAAVEWERTGDSRQAVADVMARVAEARGAWVEETAVTRDLAERAAVELRERGIDPGQEPDRVSVEEWLAHQRAVDARDEAARDVTDLDVPLVEDSTVLDSDGPVTEDDVTDVSGEAPGADVSSGESVHDSVPLEPVADLSQNGQVAEGGAPEPGARDAVETEQRAAIAESAGSAEHEAAPSLGDSSDHTRQSVEATGDEGPGAPDGKRPGLFAVISTFFSAMRTGEMGDWRRPLRDEPAVEPVVEEPADEEEAATDVQPTEDDPQDVAEEPAAVVEGPEPEAVQEPLEAVEDEAEPARVSSRDVAPVEPADVELDALVTTAKDAQDRMADRESEEAVHDAWEAEESAPLAEGSSGTDDDVAEAGVSDFAEAVL